MTISKKTLDRLKQFATDGDSCATGVLHILERLEVLEALLPAPEAAPVATDEAPQLWILWNHLGSRSPEGQAIRKYLGMGQFESMSDLQIEAANQYQKLPLSQPAQPPAAPPAPPSAPAGGLVERVALAIGDGDDPINWKPEARREILEVVAWARENHAGYNAARWLEQEADHA
jgi:hypothetical protein